MAAVLLAGASTESHGNERKTASAQQGSCLRGEYYA